MTNATKYSLAFESERRETNGRRKTWPVAGRLPLEQVKILKWAAERSGTTVGKLAMREAGKLAEKIRPLYERENAEANKIDDMLGDI